MRHCSFHRFRHRSYPVPSSVIEAAPAFAQAAKRSKRPAAAALRQPEVQERQSSHRSECRLCRCLACISSRVCRLKSFRNMTTGARSAMPMAQKAGSTRRCSRATRTAIAAPWMRGKGKGVFVNMRRDPQAGGAIIARIEPGVVVHVGECNGEWCRARRKAPKAGWRRGNLGRLSGRSLQVSISLRASRSEQTGFLCCGG
jgi:hypothetical protein